jgi:hypothetical protein
VVSNKVSKSARDARDERAARARRSALAAPRRRVHSLAPEHVGEIGSVAALAVAVLGLALFILAITLVVGGLTLGGRYTGGSLPPNLGAAGWPIVLSGAGLAVYSLLVVAAPVALLADVRRARLATVFVSAISAVGAAGILAYVLSQGSSEAILLAALGVMIFFFGASALILARPGR